METILFIALPYAAMALCVLVLLLRLRARRRGAAGEPRRRLRSWGMGVFHLGIMTILTGHLLGLLIPGQVLQWNLVPVRLLVLEATGMAFALLALLGLVVHVRLQLTTADGRRGATPIDWLFAVALLVQISSGMHIATALTWGSAWYATSMTPYLWSLLALRPEVAAVSAMPFSVQLHVVAAWLVIGLFPFTRTARRLGSLRRATPVPAAAPG